MQSPMLWMVHMLLLLRYFCLFTIILPTSMTFADEVISKPKMSKTTKIIWIIEDTFEWQDYINKVSKTTSQDTAKIIMLGLEGLGFKLTFVKATGGRAEKILQNEVNACMSSRIKNIKREKFSIFSLPHEIYLGQQLYRVAQTFPLNEEVLNSRGEIISLALLFNYYPKQVLAIPTAVSYGVKIDKQIAELNSDNVFIRAGANRITSLTNMLLKNRIDYIIAYPQDINIINPENISIEGYTIADSPPYFLGHVSCSKTAIGALIIQRINEILQQAYQSTEFYYAHEKWLLSGDLPKLRKHFQEVFHYLPDVNYH